MKRDEPNNKASSFLAILFILLFVILIVGIIGFFYFSQLEIDGDEEEVEFWLYRHPTQVAGDESTFFIFIKNQEVRDVKNAEVVVNFPKGFVLNKSTPQCEKILTNSCQWSFDSIRKGTLKEIELIGQLFGEAGQPQLFTGYLHFQLEGFTSEFEKNLSSSVMISPALYVGWDKAKKGSLFDPLESTLTLENITSKTIDKAQVILQWPQDFIFKSVSSETEKDTAVDKNARILTWRITNLNFYDKKELTLKGEFIGASSDVLEFKAQAGIIRGDDFFIQTEETKTVMLERFDFIPELTISNIKDTPQVYSWGDTLPITIGYTNNTNEGIKDVTLSLIFSTDKYIDLNHLYEFNWSYYSGQFIQRGLSPYFTAPFSASIINSGWDKSIIESLEQVSMGNRGVITFDLPLKQSLDALKNKYSQAEFSIYIIATGAFETSEKQWKVKSNLVNIKVNTNLTLEAVSRYYDDEGVTLGIGPLPPQQGEETSYWIFLNLKNTTNPVNNVLISTRLTGDALWTDQAHTTHGLLLYNKDTREVTWQISELPLYVGGPYSLVEARFELSIVPKQDQVGLFLPLTKDIILRAQDNFTNDSIFSMRQFLSTDITNP